MRRQLATLLRRLADRLEPPLPTVTYHMDPKGLSDKITYILPDWKPIDEIVRSETGDEVRERTRRAFRDYLRRMGQITDPPGYTEVSNV
jgi:hypothetical protein